MRGVFYLDGDGVCMSTYDGDIITNEFSSTATAYFFHCTLHHLLHPSIFVLIQVLLSFTN
jgi:hypothetical protein